MFIETGRNLLFSAKLVGQRSVSIGQRIENESGSEPNAGIAVQSFTFVTEGPILSSYVNPKPAERENRRTVAQAATLPKRWLLRCLRADGRFQEVCRLSGRSAREIL